jgi:hypothetical protein
MDERGKPPRVAIVRDMANILLAKRDESAAPPTVSVNWVRNFVKHYNKLESKFSRKYDYKRALCEDSQAIREWFDLVRSTIEKYGILLENIYNFDKIGFLIGIIATIRVITGSERSLCPKVIQPGNREWVTIIEGVNACGWSLPLIIILKGKNHQAFWYEIEGLSYGGVIAVSENGWISNQLGLFWLKKVFNKHTQSRTIGRYRLLILDGHGSHSGPEFDQFCTENSIISLYMLPHSSHLLQPLNVSCFFPLKRAYRQEI